MRFRLTIFAEFNDLSISFLSDYDKSPSLLIVDCKILLYKIDDVS